MKTFKEIKKIGIIGGGPAGLFMYKRLVETGERNMHITIYERQERLGAGMPYSTEGACMEHVTNVSDNEIPELVTTIQEWIHTADPVLLQRFEINLAAFSAYKVIPRLLFGEYLAAQFLLLQQAAHKAGMVTEVKNNTVVTDIADHPPLQKVNVFTLDGAEAEFDAVIICTGHHWPFRYEGKVQGWFDSPYPPAKLARQVNFPVAVKGASLTAIDAVRTLARHNGKFIKNGDGSLTYKLYGESAAFKLVLHAIDGLLPALRFHLDDPLLHKDSLLTEAEVQACKKTNEGFVPLDYIFDYSFKRPLRHQQPEFYKQVKDMSLEQFVTFMMSFRESVDAFTLFKAEFAEAEKSIRRQQSVYWKEMLAVLSYSMNYPAKHFSAEDMLRLKKVLIPLIAIIIAFVPQSAYHELIALYEAGVLSLVAVGDDSKVAPASGGGAVYTFTDEAGRERKTCYNMFIDAVGQPHFMYPDFPFKSLLQTGSISAAFVKFQSNKNGARELANGNQQVDTDSEGNYFLQVPGVQINDHFQVVDRSGDPNNRIYIMAVPYISGLNPDYSGLDFCETASAQVALALTDKTNR